MVQDGGPLDLVPGGRPHHGFEGWKSVGVLGDEVRVQHPLATGGARVVIERQHRLGHVDHGGDVAPSPDVVDPHMRERRAESKIGASGWRQRSANAFSTT
ncbi:hypothetical protein [Azorhizobium sp. AG788]|uniref:hypothetical protein n=1 Tax=Azorhizobium sp. AG788 TaxID=2183897 RepID=UPI003138C6FA